MVWEGAWFLHGTDGLRFQIVHWQLNSQGEHASKTHVLWHFFRNVEGIEIETMIFFGEDNGKHEFVYLPVAVPLIVQTPGFFVT